MFILMPQPPSGGGLIPSAPKAITTRKFPLPNIAPIPSGSTTGSTSPALPLAPGAIFSNMAQPLIIRGVQTPEEFLRNYEAKLPKGVQKLLKTLPCDMKISVDLCKNSGGNGECFLVGTLNSDGTVTPITLAIKLSPEVLEGVTKGDPKAVGIFNHELAHAIEIAAKPHSLPTDLASAVEQMVQHECHANGTKPPENLNTLAKAVAENKPGAVEALVTATNRVVKSAHVELARRLYATNSNAKEGDNVVFTVANMYDDFDNDNGRRTVENIYENQSTGTELSHRINSTFNDLGEMRDIYPGLNLPSNRFTLPGDFIKAQKAVLATIKELERLGEAAGKQIETAYKLKARVTQAEVWSFDHIRNETTGKRLSNEVGKFLLETGQISDLDKYLREQRIQGTPDELQALIETLTNDLDTALSRIEDRKNNDIPHDLDRLQELRRELNEYVESGAVKQPAWSFRIPFTSWGFRVPKAK